MASINEAADDEEEGDNDVVTGGDGVTGDDDTHLLKSVSVETASFASTMGNQVISVHITILPEVRIWRYWMLITVAISDGRHRHRCIALHGKVISFQTWINFVKIPLVLETKKTAVV